MFGFFYNADTGDFKYVKTLTGGTLRGATPRPSVAPRLSGRVKLEDGRVKLEEGRVA